MSIDQIFQYAIYFLLMVLVVLGIRYMWLSITQRLHYPEMWIYKQKQKKIHPSVLSIEKRYNDKVRLYNFWFQLTRIDDSNVDGALAELGVYKGESAELIHKLSPNRDFYLFDTFKGFEKSDIIVETGEAATYKKTNFADTDIEVVKEKLGNSKKLIYRIGYFPDSAKDLENINYAFVNIDADLHKPVKAALEYFYPKLSPGGVIIIHDYTHKWEGLTKAVDQFVKKIPESIIHVPDRYGTVMIIKNYM